MKQLTLLQKQLLLGFIFFLAAMFDRLILGNHTEYASFLLVYGGMLAVVYIVDSNQLLPMTVGAFFGYLLSGLMVISDEHIFVIVQSVLIPFIYIAIAHLFKLNYGRKYLDQKDDVKSYVIYFFDAVMTAFIGSIALSTVIVFTTNDLSFTFLFIKHFQYLFYASLIITLPLLLLYIYSIKLSFQRQLLAILFLTLFTGFYILMFTPSFNYVLNNFYFIIIIVTYVTMAYYFNFIILVSLNILYLLLSRVLFFDMWFPTTNYYNLIAIDGILIISTAIFIIAKKYTFTLHIQKVRLKEANQKVEKMFSSIIGLMQLTEWIELDHTNHKFDYLEKVFDIAYNLFDRFDAMVLAYKSGHVTRYINAKGLPLHIFQQFQPKSSHFEWETNHPIVYKKPNDNYKRIFGKDYILAKKHLSKVSLDIRIPIQTGENNYGAIAFLSYKNSDYFVDKQVIRNLRLFQQMVNLVYHISMLNHKTNSLKDDIVLSLIRTLELFDEYTGSHSEQVAEISLLIARQLRLTNEEQTTIYWAGIVHDIGKIGVGYDIVNKAGSLTSDEYQAIKQHPIYGFNILSRSADLKDIAKLVRHHHEWYNGNGYPDGLKKDEIPLGAQILCVADAISAMSTKRTYSPIKDHSQIIDELKLYSETQFNPKLVDIAIQIIQSNALNSIIHD